MPLTGKSRVRHGISTTFGLGLMCNTDVCFYFVSFVSDKMGGAVDKESLSTFSYELPIGQLKCELNSNIIPIGKIKTGIFYHRALLFKVIKMFQLSISRCARQ